MMVRANNSIWLVLVVMIQLLLLLQITSVVSLSFFDITDILPPSSHPMMTRKDLLAAAAAAVMTIPSTAANASIKPLNLQEGSDPSSSASTIFPHTTHYRSSYFDDDVPLWDPSSPSINENGFLRTRYERIPGAWESANNLLLQEVTPCMIRQVPGDGNCLFHSISLLEDYASHNDGTHIDLTYRGNLQWLYQNSANLRQQAVDCLEKKRSQLYLCGREYIYAEKLVHGAALQYGISSQDYCRVMRQDSYWGGGPEIVALSNVLQRPIHLYGLFGTSHGDNFVLKPLMSFGSPKFDDRKPLHILVADSRFPYLDPGTQLSNANHFLAIFPEA